MEKVQIPRKFILKEGNKTIELPDPSPTMSPDKVREFYEDDYPDLVNAKVSSGDIKDDCIEYEFNRSLGTKG